MCRVIVVCLICEGVMLVQLVVDIFEQICLFDVCVVCVFVDIFVGLLFEDVSDIDCCIIVDLFGLVLVVIDEFICQLYLVLVVVQIVLLEFEFGGCFECYVVGCVSLC